MSVKYRGRQVGFGDPAPSSISRRHEKPKYGDAQSAIWRSKGRALDINERVVLLWFKVGGRRIRKRVPVSGHWGYLGRDGYTHTTRGPQKGLRPLTKAEKRLSYQQWVDRHGGDTTALNSLRKRGYPGGPINNYPMTWHQQVAVADRADAVLNPELKVPAFTLDEVVDHMIEVCERADYPLWPMTLLWMKWAREKVAAFRRADADIAIIFGNRRYLAYGKNKIADWPYKPTQIWGPSAARRWLRV